MGNKIFIFLLLSLINVQLTGQNLDLIDIAYNSFVFNNDADIWISSQGGWNRWNGVKLIHYLVNDTISGIKGEWIQSSFFKDSTGKYWTCTFDHLCYYTYSEDIFYCNQLFLNNNVVDENIQLIGIDYRTQFPVLKAGNTLCYYNQKKNTLIPFSKEYKVDVPLFKSSISSIDTIIGFGGIENQKIETWKRIKTFWNREHFDLSKCNELSEVHVSDAVLIGKETYLATNEGLTFFEEESYCKSKLIDFYGSNYKSYHLIYKEGFIILSTDKFGLLVYDVVNKNWAENINFTHLIFSLNRKQPVEIFDLGEEILIGYRNANPQFIDWSELLPLLKFQTNTHLNFIPESIYGGNEFKIISDNRGKIEIYANNEFWDKISIDAIGAVRNYSIFRNLLFFHDESCLWKYDLHIKKLQKILETESNSLQQIYFYQNIPYAIVENRAFEIVDGELNKVMSDKLNHDIISYQKISENSILICKYNQAILVNNQDTITIPTDSYIYDQHFNEEKQLLYLGLGKGLGVYDLKRDSFRIQKIHGTRVNKIYTNENEGIILATSDGIYNYRDSEEVIRIESKVHNVKELIIEDTLIHFMCEDGLRTIPFQLQNNENPAKLSVTKENHQKDKGKNESVAYSYKYDMQPLRINVASDSWRSNSNGHISFKLDGYDYSMEKQSFKEAIQLPPLAAGNYVLHITGQDEYLNAFEPLSIGINVKGPIWLRWWFIVATSGLILFLIWAYIRYKTLRFESELAIAEEINELEKAALQAQMNPHFIFNCLNSIQNFIMENDKESAMEYLGKFAKLIRLNLRASAEEKISLEEEIFILDNYLNLEQLRLNNRFDYSIELAKPIKSSEIHIPGMLIQPFVENAVIHGMKNIKENGLIKITFDRNESELLVSITDNGTQDSKELPKPNTKKSYGVSITQKRLHHINKGNKSNLKINHTLKGTQVFLDIKI